MNSPPNEAEAQIVPKPDAAFVPAVDKFRPPVFLMIESLATGGSERQFCELAGALDRDQFDVRLSCIRQRGPWAQEFGEIPQFPLGGSLYGLQSWRTRLRLARHLKSYCVAVAHAFDFYSNMTLVPAAWLARVPVVIGSQRQVGDLLTRAQWRAQMAVFRLCDAVVCNSQAAADRLIAAGLAPSRVAVIGNALSPELFAVAPSALPRRPGLLRVGMIARMNARYKNHQVVLRAAAALIPQFSAIEFLLVGDGPLRGELEQLAEDLGMRNQVRFLGDRRDIPAVLASMDVSVVPSASESLSNVALESMAAGVAVVATDVGGNPELINAERGLLVPANDEQALAAALGRVLRDAPLRAAMALSAKAFAYENFSRAKVVGQYQNLYAELLERRQSRSSKKGKPVSSKSARKQRIAFIAPSLKFVGGQSVQADLLLRHWRNDAEVEAEFIPVDPRFPFGLRWAEKVPFLRTIIREPLYLFSLWRGLAHADVAHIFSASYWSFLIAPAPAWLIAKWRKKRTVINYRSGEARDHLRRFRSAHPVLRRADVLIVPSGYLVDVFQEFGLSARVVPNIVDLTQFSFRERKPLRPHLVCTRGFRPYYCIDVVVHAFAVVQRAFPEARLDLVGKGPLEEQIRKLVRELSLQGVNFAGVASRQEIGRHYDEADIFINASRLDNMPVSVIEAFASGTPVVTTSPESMPYLVEHERTGLLSEPGDPVALAENVIRLLNDAALASRLAQAAYEESRRYRWTAVRQQWLDVYESICPKRNQVTTALPGGDPELQKTRSADSVHAAQ